MLSKLSIQGIRSFGADHDEKIEFFSPLTLILGQNGTGKTTVIECLKYITTGVFPPGTKGGAFVHDPKLDRSSEVKGQIKLQFRSGTNNLDCMVHRSMAVTMKGMRPTFRSIDGYLRVKEPGKDPKTISMKCGDLDHEMCGLLGVSKPVLEHVIFCHQDESNWPLGEGKALKQKFDDIFASGRYAKALDAMVKLQKENAVEMKILEKDVMYSKDKKSKAAELRARLENFQTQLTRTVDASEKLETQLQPIQDELKGLDKLEQQTVGIQAELSKVNALYEVLSSQVKDLERVCPRERKHADIADLKDELDRLRSRSDDWRGETDRLNRKRVELSKRLESLQAEKQKIAVRERELEMLNRQIEDKRAQRAKLSAQMNELMGSNSSQDESSGSLRRLVADELSRLSVKRATLTEQFDREEAAIEEDLNAATGRRAFLDNNIREKEREKIRFEADLKKINSDLQDVNTSQARARQLAADITDAERKLANAEASVSVGETESEYNELLTQKTKLTQEQQQLTQQLSRAHKAVEVETKLGFLTRDKTSKEEKMAEAEKQIRSKLSMHGYEKGFDVEVTELYDALEAKRLSLRTSSVSTERELEASRSALATIEGAVDSSRKRLNDSQKELEKIRSRIASLLSQCGEHDIETVQQLDERIIEIQETLEASQHELTTATSNESMMKGYIDLMEASSQPEKPPRRTATAAAPPPTASSCHSSCPLCERPFSTETERSRVVTSIRSRLSSSLPERQAQLKRTIASTKSKLDGLRTLKPAFNDRQRLESDAARLKQTIEENQHKADTLRRETEALRSKVANDREALNEFASLLSEASTLKQTYSEMADLDDRIDECQREHAAVLGANKSSSVPASNMTAAQLSSKLERKALELKNVEEQIDLHQRRIREDRELIESCRDRLLKLRQDKVDIDSKQQKRVQLEADRDRIDGDLQRVKQALEAARTEALPIGSTIQEAERRRNAVRQRRDTELREFSERAQKLKDLNARLQEADGEIHRMLASSNIGGLGTVADRYEELKEQAVEVASQIETVSSELALATKEISEVTRSVDGQKAAERELQDAMMLQEKRKELIEKSKKKEDLEKQLQSVIGPGKSIRDRQNDLRRREAEYMEEKIETNAHRNQLLEQVKTTKDSLGGEYKDAEKKYREFKAKYKVMALANEDLKNYYRLVDKALLTFHTRKMTEINRIIGEIWQSTYKGGDIDTIEIHSDAETIGTDAATKRRTYNYRLVMKKGDAALDMRGRCSAGQKVLASIIIRLALSEAFAGNCHILALDEPTTNLDRENIESLAHALVKIIQLRAIRSQNGGENFQLLVITHDTDFIELLGRLSDFADQFYLMQRDDRGETRVTRKNVSDLVSATSG